MAEPLTAKRKWFIQRMNQDDEHAQWGFELLLKRQDFADFFDQINEEGLFGPEHNSAPIPATDPGYVRIPYWPALGYLKACARQAGERNNLQLARKVMTVLEAVSRAREPDGSIRDNYHSFRVFAEILGLLPTGAITTEALELIPEWLASRFDRGMVGYALANGALLNCLASESSDDWSKACLILHHCTAIRWVDERELGENRKKPVTVVDDHWLKKLIELHASVLGAKTGRVASDIFLERIREVFGKNNRDLPSWLSRPAIEEHPQNHSWEGPANRFVGGLRDVLLSWVDHDVSAARPFIEALLRDEAEIVRRIGIFVLGQRWRQLQSVYAAVLSPRLFDNAHLHELYRLLRDRFDEFTDQEKAATIAVIRQLPPPVRGEDSNRLLKRSQRIWLSAVAGKSSEPADSWVAELMSDQTLGALSEHPDFHSYIESWWGPGPTPYRVQELQVFADDGSLVERLNNFQQPDSWRGPTTRALVDTLEELVAVSPEGFLPIIPTFLQAKRPYQYGIINGFKRAWETPAEKRPKIDWDRAWNLLVTFFEQLIGDSDFWAEKAVEDKDLTPNRDWIPPLIAEFLRAGTRNDERACSEELLPRTWSLIGILLAHAKSEDSPDEDAMTQAINSPKGKVIEALFNHALRACRLSDRASGEHAAVWFEMKPIFESEIAQCKKANYEFSTLAANYIANLDYIDRDWLRANLENIFPRGFPSNFHSAMEGLAYAPATRAIYALLAEGGVLEFALQQESKGRHAREKLVERIALAFLWGDEELDGSHFSYLFEPDRVEDLEQATIFLWSASNQELSRDQESRILSFWARCVAWSRNAAEPPAKLLSQLSRLSCYLKSVEDHEQKWLLAVAPYVYVDDNADYFIEELDRLVDLSPAKISAVLGKVLETYHPTYDFEDRLKSLLTKLAEHRLKAKAISYADQLRNLPGMAQLFAKLTAGS